MTVKRLFGEENFDRGKYHWTDERFKLKMNGFTN